MKIYLIQLSNNYGGSCQSLYALQNLLDKNQINNELICPYGTLLKPDYVISKNKLIGFFNIMFIILKNKFINNDNNNFYLLNTVLLAPLSFFQNSLIWIHEVTLDGKSWLYNFLKLIVNIFSREIYIVNQAMLDHYPKASLLPIPYKYLKNVYSSKPNFKSRENQFKACMIVRPIKNKGINAFIDIAINDLNNNYVLLTNLDEFELFNISLKKEIPNNLFVKDFNNKHIRENILLSSTFHLNLSNLPETVGLNTVEAISYGCLCFSTDNIGSRMILDSRYIIKNKYKSTFIEYLQHQMKNLNNLEINSLKNKQFDKIFNHINDKSHKIFIKSISKSI